MPWNGSGTFSKTSTSVSPAVDSTTIDAAAMNTYTTDVTSGINACLAKNGENAVTGDLDLGSQKITLLADGTAHTDAANLGQIQDAAHAYAVDDGSASVLTAAFTPAVTAYAAGQAFRIMIGAGNSNTGAVNLDIDGVGAKNVLDHDLVELRGGELLEDGVYTFIYDGTQFQLQSSMHKGTHVTGDGSFISDTVFDLTDLTNATWEGISNTTGADTHVWTALDSVPVGVDWIEVKIRQVLAETSTATLIQQVFAIADGQTQASTVKNIVAYAGIVDDDTNDKEVLGLSTVKIPVESDGSVGIEMYCVTTGGVTSHSSEMVLTGYGWN